MKKFLITTLLGGLLFLVPLVVVAIVLGKAYKIMLAIAAPLERMLPVDSVAGIGLLNVLAAAIMLLLCFTAGLIARSGSAQAFYRRIDGILLEFVPGYAWSKTVMKNLSGEVATDRFKPVLVRLDDQQQLAFEMERCPDGRVVVFFPGAPDVRSGTVAFVASDRVESLDTTLLTLNRSLKHMGQGAAGIVAGERA